MRIGETSVKAPGDELDYTFKWKTWLDQVSDTISSSVMSVDSGLTIVTDTSDTNSATVWISGGQNGCTYKVTNTITTAAVTPRVKQAHFYLRVETPDVTKNRAYS